MERPMHVATGSALVAGTAIGAGMLALPVATAGAGLGMATLIYFFSWLFSLSTGLLFAEALSWSKPHSNLLTLARSFFGRFGAAATWGLYLFLFYSLLVAYMAGGGQLVRAMLPSLSPMQAILSFTLFFGLFTIAGPKSAGRLNSLLFGGLVLCYGLLLFLAIPKLDFTALSVGSFKPAFLALPIVFTSFSYHGTLPTLYEAFHRDLKRLRRSIIIGSTIPFIVYILWDLVVKGIVSPENLFAAQVAGASAIEPLSATLPSTPISFVGQLFAFFALTTSMIGVGLGMIDFLADSIHASRRGRGSLFLGLAVFIPPMLMAIIDPTIFLNALQFAGGIGCALLLGLLPIALVFAGRYIRHSPFIPGRLLGGKWTLSLLLLFVLANLGVMIHFLIK